jgi:dihydroorotase
VDVAISKGRIVSVSPSLSQEGFSVIECQDQVIVPGFVDVHVHLREPGFSYKETIASGTAAAAAGGYTAVCAMPNLNPVPDSLEHLWPELDAIARDGRVRVYPYGAITRGEKGAELADMPAMEPFVCGFSDDGKGVQSADQMRDAMELAKQLDKPITAHCEDESLLTPGWCIHDGEWAKRNGFPGNAPESEWKQVERDLELVRETGCRYHVCHVSTKESVALIRKAKAEGLPVSCETGPHYLILCDEDLMDDGRFKMNPPIRSAADRDALIEGLLDGTIDCIATDHAPHTPQEKADFLKAPNGSIGMETSLAATLTALEGALTLSQVIEKMSTNPARILGIPAGTLQVGANADVVLFDPEKKWVVDPEKLHGKSKNTPFKGMELKGKVALTIFRGRIVYDGR